MQIQCATVDFPWINPVFLVAGQFISARTETLRARSGLLLAMAIVYCLPTTLSCPEKHYEIHREP